jgi:hypothetical protein
MRKRYRKILVTAALSALASTAIFASAADAAKPAAPYEDFAGCPSRAENPSVASCIKYVFNGGSIGIGKREVPVTNPIVLRGGYEQITGNFIYNAEGGIVPVKQTVPGGLVGMTGFKWLNELSGSKEQLKLYATVELAGAPGSISAPDLKMPVKIHLENPALGNGCYIGTTASPIPLELSVAKAAGRFKAEAEREEVQTTVTPGEMVDSSYAVPGATGCQLKVGPFTIPINEVVDAAYGLPATAGTDTTKLNFLISTVEPEVVYP